MDYNEEKAHEHIEDAKGSSEQMSNCCSAAVYILGEAAICADCKEYCDIVTGCEQPGCEGMVEGGKCDNKNCPGRAFSADQQSFINKAEAACAAAGCDDDGHKCNK